MNPLPPLTPKERARRYLARVPGAIAGAGGDHQTITAAMIAVNDFALGEPDALEVLVEWNQKCQPRWTEAQLRLKVRSACQSASGVRGSKLREPNPTGKPCPSLPPMNHAPVAKEILPPAIPDRTGFAPGTREQLQALAEMRPYQLKGLYLASARGLLVFGRYWRDEVDCYGVTDRSGHVLELRRMDGQPFPATQHLPERKSHSVQYSRKQWPLGILEASVFPAIALVEGVPDFLTAHYEVLWEVKEHTCGVVAMLSGSPRIAEEALPYFKGKQVRIFPHVDPTGVRGSLRWAAQLRQAGAAKVDYLDFAQFKTEQGQTPMDLDDAFKLKVETLPEELLP